MNYESELFLQMGDVAKQQRAKRARVRTIVMLVGAAVIWSGIAVLIGRFVP